MRKLMLLGGVLALVGNGLAATPAETYGVELARPLLPKSTTSAACDAIYARVKEADLAADAVWGALLDYDWPDLLPPAPAGGKGK